MSSVKVSPGRTVLVVLAILWGMVGVSGPVAAAEVGESVLGGGLYSTGGTVSIEVLAASAGYTSTLFLFEPELVEIATNRQTGRVVEIGPYPAGQELVFGIRVQNGNEFRMGPGERNPDGIAHATVTLQADGCFVVGFEDLFGGGDRDYNDNRFEFCGGVASEPPQPEPEPPTVPYLPPSADAGDDQTVGEGSLVTLDASRSMASGLVAKVFTDQADFGGGEAVNLSISDDLRLDDVQEAFDFIWVAASGRGTVVKIDTRTGAIVGEYWSAPENRGKNPSRTTVDKDGNVWVGNRDEASTLDGRVMGSVTKIGLAENGQCVDRNGNGVIDTSTGLGDVRPWPNSGGEDTAGGVSTAADECLIEYVRTNGKRIRHVSVDAENHVWVGGDGVGETPRFFDRIDPNGTVVRSINMASDADTKDGSVPCCYGGLIDSNGIIWTATLFSNRLVRIDPSYPNGSPDLIRIINAGRTSYGLGIDPDGNVWMSNWTANSIQKFSPEGALLGTFPTGGPSADRGVAVTDDGHVWVANSGEASVSRLDNAGNLVAEIPVGVEPTGVAVDAEGMVWASNRRSNSVSRINPQTNSVDMSVNLGPGALPYNYSDMTGSTLTGAPDLGTWTVIHDSEVPGAEWRLIDWTAQTPGDSQVSFTVAASEDGVNFGSPVTVADPGALSAMTGRFLRISATLTRSSDGLSPVIEDVTVAHAGGDGGLSYLWRLVDGDGPPIFLSSSTSPRPSFLAPDDGSYLFELLVTDGAGLTDSDRVTVTVDNVAPALTLTPQAGVAGGVTQINGSFTDDGFLDTHSATISWGDGSVDDITVSAQGTGWGTFFGSHVYSGAGSYQVTVTLSDDDGGKVSSDLTGFEVGYPIAVWANSQTLPQNLDWGGSEGSIEGRVHTNNELRFKGSAKTVTGPATYANILNANTERHIFDPPVAQAPVQPFPITYPMAEYSPGGVVERLVGDFYHDMTGSCVDGVWHETQQVLAPGIYYADCAILLNGSNIGGEVTLVATGPIKLTGSRPAFEPFFDGVLAISSHPAGDIAAIEVAASDSKLLGVFFAESGQITVSGSDNVFYCGLLADSVNLVGSRLRLRGADCGRPDSTVSGPLLIPDLTLALESDRSTAAPSDSIGYRLSVSNAGALLVVPGLLGLENVDSASATVAGFDYLVERFSISTQGWETVASLGDPSLDLRLSPNTFPGVDYAGGDPVGTVIAPDGLASWGSHALLSLTPQQVSQILDPTETGALRVRVGFDTDPDQVQVRELYVFGTDLLSELRVQGGDVTNVDLTMLLPEGDPVQLPVDLSSLTPGESVTTTLNFDVPVPAPRGPEETDAGYLGRLATSDGTVLTASVFAVGSGGVGRLVAPIVTAQTTRQIPVVAVSVSGPQELGAGTGATFDAAVANIGSARAATVTMVASADGSPLTLTGAPSELLQAELANPTFDYQLPENVEGDEVALRAEATWTDSNGIAYGPVGSNLDLAVLSAATFAATLVDELAADADSDGRVSPGDTLRYTLTVNNTGDLPLTNVSATVDLDPNVDLVAGSATGGTVVEGADSVTSTFATIGGSSQLVFEVTIDDPLASGVTAVSLQGRVSADGFDPILTDDPARPGGIDSTRTTVTVPTPALAAFLSGRLLLDADATGTATAGDTLRFDLDVFSVGSQPVSGVRVTVLTPSGTSLGTVGVTAGTVNVGADVDVSIGVIDPFDQARVTFDLVIDDPLDPLLRQITVQGTVLSNELAPVTTDNPDTFEIDSTTVVIGDGSGGNGLPVATVNGFAPADGTVITESTVFTAVLQPPDGETVTGWTLSYRLADDTNLTDLASGTDPTISATFDPTLVPNGLYILVLESEVSGGGVAVFESSVVVDGRLKPGRYVTTFTDMAVGVAGFPVRVNRTYDSFDKTIGDLGVGWTLDVADFRVATNGPLGDQGWSMEGCGGGLVFVTLCFRSERPHFVTVTWPDGLTEIFDLTPANGSTFFPGLTTAEFTGRPNTTSELEALDSSLFWSDGDLLGGLFGNGGVYDPNVFRLTDRFGTEYTLEVGVGLREMRDRSGNTVTISDDGITSSFGPGIVFERDSLGRITRVVGPDTEDVTYDYDANGDLRSVTDQLGNVTTFTYFPDHFLNEILDPLDRPFTTFEYDADGRLAFVVDGEGNRVAISSDVGARTETVTDATGLLTTVYTSDERGNVVQVDEVFDGQVLTTSLTYNELDLITSRTDAAGNTWSQSYDDSGRIVSRVDPTGATVTVTYNALGLPETVTDPLGNMTRFGYDAAGNLTSMTDPLGNRETYAYDSSGRRTSRTDRVGGVTIWKYDSAGRVSSMTDATGAVATFGYDGGGRVVSVGDQRDGTTAFGYDQVGNLTSMTDPLGNTTNWTYDERYRMVSETDPTGGSTVMAYDDAGRLVGVTDPLGGITSYGYDAAGRVVSVTDQTGATTTFSYDGAGRRRSSTDPVGNTTTFEVDEYGRVTAVVDPMGNRSGTSYDPLGRVIGSVTPSGSDTAYSYDPRGLLTSVTDALGNATTNTYNEAGLLTAVTDPRGETTTYTYDPAGRLTTQTDSLGGVVSFTYDGVGRTTSVTDPNGATRSMVYDPTGNVISSTDPSGGVSTFRYDALGRPTSTTDARGIGVGRSYDANGRLVGLSTPEGPIAFTYDTAGRRTEMTDPTGTTRWSYDPTGRVIEVVAPQGAVAYAYDAAGRRTSMTTPTGTVSYGYDSASRLVSVSEPSLGSFGFTVNADGLRTGISRPNGVDTTLRHDAALRLASVVHSGPGGVIDSFTYTLDANGNRTSVTSPAGVETYAIDELNRLTQVTYPDGVVASYTYDAAGNRLSETVGGETTTYSYDGAGRLTAVGPDLVSYDQAGNVTALSGDNFSYDWAGRLSSAVVDGVSSSYTYDGLGVRVSASHGSTSSTYVWDREAVWPLLVSDGVEAYVHAGGLVGRVAPNDAAYLLADGLGSVRAVTDSTGSVVAAGGFEPFGESRTGGVGGFGFSGEQTDPTGLVFLRARYYHPGLGRLLTPDPIQPNTPGTQGWNLYSYVANNPTTWTDPTGHVALIEYSIRGATAGAVLGGGIGLFVCDDTALFDVSFGDSYPGCVFRSALAGTAGGAFTVTGGGLWAALGTGAVGGLSSGFVFQATGAVLGDDRFDPGAVLADTIIGAVTGGVLWGGARLFQTLTNHPNITPNTPRALPQELAIGRNAQSGVHVYHGVDAGKPVYAGITDDIARRQLQHGDRFVLDQLTPAAGVTRGQARAIEEALIVRNPGFQNLRHEISPRHSWYQDALDWGNDWLTGQGL